MMDQKKISFTDQDQEFGKYIQKRLAANEKETRDEMIGQLENYLNVLEKRYENDGKIDSITMMKLWYSLYYCMWMTDKTLVQLELAQTLASFISIFDKPENSFLYVQCFFLTMEREWHGIDHHRLDKYYSLVRKMLGGFIRWVAVDCKFQVPIVEKFTEILRDTVLIPDHIVSEGLRLHVAFVFIEEVRKNTGAEISCQHLQELLSPFYCVLVKPPSQLLFDKVIRVVFEPLCNEYAPRHLQDGTGFENLDLFLVSASIFNIAADSPGLSSKLRSELYALSRSLKRAGETHHTKQANSTAEIFSPKKLEGTKEILQTVGINTHKIPRVEDNNMDQDEDRNKSELKQKKREKKAKRVRPDDDKEVEKEEEEEDDDNDDDRYRDVVVSKKSQKALVSPANVDKSSSNKKKIPENPQKKLKSTAKFIEEDDSVDDSEEDYEQVNKTSINGQKKSRKSSLVGKYLSKLAANEIEETIVKKTKSEVKKTPMKEEISGSKKKSIEKQISSTPPTSTNASSSFSTAAASVMNSTESKKSVRFTGQTQAVKLNIITQKMKNPIPPSKSVPVPKSGVLKVKSMEGVSSTPPPSRAGLLEINTRKNAKKPRRLSA